MFMIVFSNLLSHFVNNNPNWIFGIVVLDFSWFVFIEEEIFIMLHGTFLVGSVLKEL
jgi:hypothetical protein